MRYRRTFQPGGTYFLTLVTHRRAPIFGDPQAIERYRRALEKVQIQRPFTIDAQVILQDHIHTLWTLPQGDSDYATRVRLIKTYCTKSGELRHAKPERSESRASKGEQSVWQRRYWEHTIRDEVDFQAHLDYIHFNPVKHGFVTAARDWPYSTFKDWVARGVYEEWWGSADIPPLPDWAGRE